MCRMQEANRMKIIMELKKDEKGYVITSADSRTLIFVCYGRTMKEVFKNLGKTFIKLNELNQLPTL
jgi:hypothetical protein